MFAPTFAPCRVSGGSQPSFFLWPLRGANMVIARMHIHADVEAICLPRLHQQQGCLPTPGIWGPQARAE